jgi:hypothetical protein
MAVNFEIVCQVESIEIIAIGTNIRDLAYLQKTYGRGRGRKLKGVARVRLPNGNLRRVELHWYEAHGIGKKDIKINTIWIRTMACLISVLPCALIIPIIRPR